MQNLWQVINQGKALNPSTEAEKGKHLLLLKQLILHLSALVSDYLITEPEAELRAVSWSAHAKPAIFDKYLNYTIKAIVVSRERKGMIHVDEFLQAWVLVKQGQVWSTRKREWVGILDQVQAIYDERPEYELNRRDFPDPSEPIQGRIKAQIYGWED